MGVGGGERPEPCATRLIQDGGAAVRAHPRLPRQGHRAQEAGLMRSRARAAGLAPRGSPPETRTETFQPLAQQGTERRAL